MWRKGKYRILLSPSLSTHFYLHTFLASEYFSIFLTYMSHTPGLITSTEDTLVFVFKGTQQTLEGWYLVDKNSYGKKSNYRNDSGGTDNKNGFHVCLIFTFNRVGMMASPFISVTRITNRELPKYTFPLGIFIISIPEICAGGNADPHDKAPGYVVLYKQKSRRLVEN